MAAQFYTLNGFLKKHKYHNKYGTLEKSPRLLVEVASKGLQLGVLVERQKETVCDGKAATPGVEGCGSLKTQ